MKRPGRPLSAATSGMIAGIAVCAALGLAACGSVAAGGGTGAQAGPLRQGGQPASLNPGGPIVPAAGKAPVKVPLCAHIASLDRAVITHTTGPMGVHMREVLPIGIMVRNPAAARALAGALCSLPRMPGGLHCPADLGGAYRLSFVAGGRTFPFVIVETSGCRSVRGLGPARWWARSPWFWQAMRQALSSGSALLRGRQGGIPTP